MPVGQAMFDWMYVYTKFYGDPKKVTKAVTVVTFFGFIDKLVYYSINSEKAVWHISSVMICVFFSFFRAKQRA